MRERDDRIANLAASIASLAGRFARQSKDSFHAMLEDTGFFESGSGLGVEELRKALGDGPSFADEWIEYSEDQRTPAGWFVRVSSPGWYEVALYNEGGAISHRSRFSGKNEACAHFIRRELGGCP